MVLWFQIRSSNHLFFHEFAFYIVIKQLLLNLTIRFFTFSHKISDFLGCFTQIIVIFFNKVFEFFELLLLIMWHFWDIFFKGWVENPTYLFGILPNIITNFLDFMFVFNLLILEFLIVKIKINIIYLLKRLYRLSIMMELTEKMLRLLF